MVTIFLLVLIYLAFISLGLPDALFGVAWPAIRMEWDLPLDAAGLILIPSVLSTVTSSFLSGIIIKKLGTGKVTMISCALTGFALLGFSLSPSFIWILILSVPLGFGAGSVDTALNNYVALHFKAHHMNWLHSFWGVGATVGPLIIAGSLSNNSEWRPGYSAVAAIQIFLAVVLLLTLPLWKKHKSQPGYNCEVEVAHKSQEKISVFNVKGIIYGILTFFFYTTAEICVGLWGSSFLIQAKNIPMDIAATWISLYYGGITAGRFLSGFISFKLSNTQMIRLGISISLAGILLMMLPLPDYMTLIALLMIGFGFSPIFPSMIHETPKNFGAKNSQAAIGFQLGFGYIGIAFMPPLVGMLLRNTTMNLFPYTILFSMAVVFLCTEKLLRNKKKTPV